MKVSIYNKKYPHDKGQVYYADKITQPEVNRIIIHTYDKMIIQVPLYRYTVIVDTDGL